MSDFFSNIFEVLTGTSTPSQTPVTIHPRQGPPTDAPIVGREGGPPTVPNIPPLQELPKIIHEPGNVPPQIPKTSPTVQRRADDIERMKITDRRRDFKKIDAVNNRINQQANELIKIRQGVNDWNKQRLKNTIRNLLIELKIIYNSYIDSSYLDHTKANKIYQKAQIIKKRIETLLKSYMLDDLTVSIFKTELRRLINNVNNNKYS